ncbi:hypothetical protein [Tersicoccus sp. Bi-70]|uniref:hypothetical protein n=1 Tax=Tersicoccus sp. Bi-70 TaxID=1897634 RepID=UPI000975A892|nr:hypothetical protein [Tersicoccus sp. Bi-70]OMH32363.1 hypothetical protein BGP79_08050 [Tersicoccus sp. Bi-70]
MVLTLLVIVIGVLLIAGIATYSSASLVRGSADRAADAAGRPADADVIEPDAAFWTGFAGIAGVIAVAALGAAIVGRAGLLLAVAAFVAILLAGTHLLRTTRQRVRQRVLDAAAGRMTALRARHDAVVERWLAYELDPGKQIEYPQMTDVSQPSAAAVVRAMRQARDARDAADEAGYADAVTRLEQTFAEAERRALGQ